MTGNEHLELFSRDYSSTKAALSTVFQIYALSIGLMFSSNLVGILTP